MAREQSPDAPDESQAQPDREWRSMTASAIPSALSFNQHRLWFLDQLEPGNPLLNISFVFRLRGVLHAEAFAHALQQIWQRHEILRTTFEAGSDGQPRQIIHPNSKPDLERLLGSALSGDSIDEKIGNLAREHALTRFDLVRGPLSRLSMVEFAPQDHVAFFTFHHIVADGWSVGVFVRELRTLVRKYTEKGQQSLPDLPMQYRDYARWQRQQLQGQRLQQLLRFWTNELDGVRHDLELYTDRPRPAVASSAGDAYRCQIPGETTTAIVQLGRQLGVTPFVTLLAALAAIIRRYTDSNDFLIGIPVASRHPPETYRLIGIFVNLLPIRIHYEPSSSFRQFCQAVGRAVAEALRHQELPFDKLVDAVHVQRSDDRHPLVQVVFNYANFPLHVPKTESGLKVERIDFHPGISRFDLGLLIEKVDGEFKCQWEYKTDLYEAHSIQQMSQAWINLIQAALSNPDVPVNRLPLVDSGLHQQLVQRWSQTETMPFDNACIHNLFEKQAEDSPHRVALVDAQGQFTYRQLDLAAESVAGHLKSADLSPESPIAILMERGRQMVAALLGILKSGHAYLPMDTSWPIQRLHAVLSESRAPLLLTDWPSEKWGSLVPQESSTAVSVLSITDRLGNAQGQDRTDTPDTDRGPIECDPSRLAYIIFTSGSTGRPKGVMIEHRSVVNVIRSFCRSYQLSADDRVLQQSSVAFDVSVNEIFPILCAGGRLVIPSASSAADFDHLADLVESQGITILGATPSGLTELNRRVDKLQSLRLVLSGGERLDPSHIDRLREIATVTNGYGPTETTVCATYCELNSLDKASHQTIPIGKPLPNYRVFVLGDGQQLVPIGCPGELCISGIGLARGYLNDPQQTAKKFVESPFESGARLFRTGDLVRWNPSGNLEFIGRIDRQVKIRGFRIELGEIESVLRSHPRVLQCAVVVDTPRSSRPRLVAYVVSADGCQDGLRDYLVQRLPMHMIPGLFVSLPALPVTANGKLDLTRLPKPEFQEVQRQVPFVAPRDDDELRMAQIWSQVLRVPHVSIHDDFFEMGGYSLLASQILHLIQQEFRVSLSYRAFFEALTVANCVSAVRQLQPLSVKPGGDQAAAIFPERSSSEVSFLATLRQLLQSRDDAAEGQLELKRDAQLDSRISAEGLVPAVAGPEGDQVFLTGGTGFLALFFCVNWWTARHHGSFAWCGLAMGLRPGRNWN